MTAEPWGDRVCFSVGTYSTFPVAVVAVVARPEREHIMGNIKDDPRKFRQKGKRLGKETIDYQQDTRP